DIQPGWLEGSWRHLCTALVGAAIGTCLAAPAIVLCYVLNGHVVSALTWAVTFWLIWTLRALQPAAGAEWGARQAALVTATCVGGALLLGVFLPATEAAAGPGFLVQCLQLGLALTIAWGLTWLVRSGELLALWSLDWWRRHRWGIAACAVLVVLPLGLAFPAGAGPQADAGSPWVAVPAGAGQGLLLGVGVGAASVPFWQVARWARLLRPALAVVAVCLAVVV